MYNHKSLSDALEDIAEPTKFMNPTIGNTTIGIALTIVFFPQSPVPMVIEHARAFFVVNDTVSALRFPVTVLSLLAFLA
jgi:hypothetical protein